MRVWLWIVVLAGCADTKAPETTGLSQQGSGADGGEDSGDVAGWDGDADADVDGGVADDTGDSMPTTVVGGDEACEPLAEGACMLPWPSDRYLKPAVTNTALTVDYDPDATWINVDGAQVDVSPFSRLDGFSPSSQILTLFSEPADTEGTAFWDSIERSLEEDHPTVLLDMETGERLPHWIENDARATDPGETVLFIRPINRLDENHRYGVAIRGLPGVSGALLESSSAFAALRDGVRTERDDIERRRSSFEELFESLEAAGVERESLQQAWWFHTASDETTRLSMKQMRDLCAYSSPRGNLVDSSPRDLSEREKIRCLCRQRLCFEQGSIESQIVILCSKIGI